VHEETIYSDYESIVSSEHEQDGALSVRRCEVSAQRARDTERAACARARERARALVSAWGGLLSRAHRCVTSACTRATADGAAYGKDGNPLINGRGSLRRMRESIGRG
jgi:hypothetical protein